DLLAGEAEPDSTHLALLKSLVALMVAEPERAPDRQEMALVESAIRQTYARAAGVPVFLHDLVRTLRTFEQVGAHHAGPEEWAAVLNPVAADSLVGMFRRFRKFGAGIMAISQRVEDFENEHARGILENAPVKVLTRAADADRVAPLLGLNDQYRMLWKSLAQRRGVFSEALVIMDLQEGREGGVVVVRDIPEDYLIATTTAEERRERDRLAARMGTWEAI